MQIDTIFLVKLNYNKNCPSMSIPLFLWHNIFISKESNLLVWFVNSVRKLRCNLMEMLWRYIMYLTAVFAENFVCSRLNALMNIQWRSGGSLFFFIFKTSMSEVTYDQTQFHFENCILICEGSCNIALSCTPHQP